MLVHSVRRVPPPEASSSHLILWSPPLTFVVEGMNCGRGGGAWVGGLEAGKSHDQVLPGSHVSILPGAALRCHQR